ncbi:MAG: PBP1A family penicillin-binding protein [Deltaproteobacteria bacterium]|nr:PBP1A family penicillin-binding protein [Deltaproteobacteria bacterium]
MTALNARKTKRRFRPARLFAKLALVSLSLALAAMAAYGWHVSRDVEKRFSGRRWCIPSTVYSDTTLIYPGQRIRPDALLDKLQRLGYRAVAHPPKQKGQFHRRGNSLDIWLNDVNLSVLKREGFPVKIDINKRTILKISHGRSGASIPLLELAPEALMRFFGPEREQRRLISIDRVPEHVQRAFMAAEDTRFMDHFGLDLRGILRAAYVNLRHGGIQQGGSTITQQLAKNYFLTPKKTLSRKIKEMILALVIEQMYTKDQILEIYLNEVYFGQKGSVAVNGLGEASYFYFAKPAAELTLAEGATLAGLLRAPNRDSPYADLQRARQRRDQVLEAMAEQGWISAADCAAAVASPVRPAGFTAYGKRAPYFMDYLSRQAEALYSKDDLAQLGLSIFTTLDTEVQQAAETALTAGLERLEKRDPALRRRAPGSRLQGAIIVMQPKTGYILAMVGGRDYAASQFNRITQARRQPGSAFKPFVFLSALDRFSPASFLSNAPVTYQVDGKAWRPRNFSPMAAQRVTLRTALAHSINIATVDLAMKIGLDKVVQTASAFAFSTPLKPHPALALGAMEVIPLELARAYCAFAADGLLPSPLCLKEISDDTGRVLNRRHMAVNQVIPADKAFLINSMLNSAVVEGTARSLKRLGIGQPVAGKTGTTNGSRDAWFVGYTPEILALVWVGCDDGSSMKGTGASAALPIWADLMRRIPQHLSGAWFQRPAGVVDRVICAESGQLAVTGRCPQPVREFFLEPLAPAETCTLHQAPPSRLQKFFEEVKDLVDKL